MSTNLILKTLYEIKGFNNNAAKEVIEEEDFSDNPSEYEEYVVEEDVAEELLPAPVQGLNAIIDLAQDLDEVAPGVGKHKRSNKLNIMEILGNHDYGTVRPIKQKTFKKSYLYSMLSVS